MQLTQFSDYSLRVLIYLGNKKAPATVQEISKGFQVNRNHLVKVVHRMAQLGLLNTAKGSKGGISLSKDPSFYKVGDIVKMMEPHLDLVECFDSKSNTCPIIGVCDLQVVLTRARDEFIAHLNKYSLQDLLITKNTTEKLKRLGLS